jgi:LPS-assembly protein
LKKVRFGVLAALGAVVVLGAAPLSAQDAPMPAAAADGSATSAPPINSAPPVPAGTDSAATPGAAPAAVVPMPGTPAANSDATSSSPLETPSATSPVAPANVPSPNGAPAPAADAAGTAAAPAVLTTPPVSNAGDQPVTITADGDNSYIGDLATADDNVIITYKGDTIYADHAIYDRSTKVVTLTGDVRIYTGDRVYRGDVVTYNLDTKAMTSANFKSLDFPREIWGKDVSTPDQNHYRIHDANFTTSNEAHPSFHLEATTMEYRVADEVVMKNVLLYIGDVPVMYFPIFVQSLKDSRPVYQFDIGNSGKFGAFIDNKYNFVLGNNMRGTAELDYREKRGYAGGVDVQYYPTTKSDILLRTYYAQDYLYASPNPNFPRSHGDVDGNSNVFDGVPSENRYAISYQQHLNFSEDFSSIADLNKWSDPWVTRDYFPSEYQQQNQPPNFIEGVEYNPNFTMDLLVMPQANPFFQTTERLPEFGVDAKQQHIFNSPIEYSSTNSVVNFQQRFANTANFEYPQAYLFNSFPHEDAYDYYHPGTQNYQYNTAQQNDYSAFRYDTYQELSYAHQFFNFLSLSPRVGGRFTYYSDDNSDINDTYNNNGQTSDKVTNPKARLAVDAGLSGDFKLSRTWLDVKDPNLGIDGIRHVFEPFFDAEYAPSPTVSPNQIRGFDDRLYSTVPPPLDWTEYNSIDSIDKEAVVRFGAWNKIETKRDGQNYDLMTWQSYADADFDHNFSAANPNGTLSDWFNDVRIYPTPQFGFRTYTAFDIAGGKGGYNEIDNSVLWQPDPSLQITVGENYLNHSEVFPDGHTATVSLFYRLNEHWQIETVHSFEATTGHLQEQQYTIYRDMDAWKLALTASDTDDQGNGKGDEAIFFSLTLKAFPNYNLHTPHL